MILFFLMTIGAASAWSALPARVIEETFLMKGPSADAIELEALASGRALAIGNRPIGNFYKARTSEGKIGFVQASALRIFERSTVVESQSEIKSSESQVNTSADASDWPWTFRIGALAGGLFYNANAINQSLEIETGGVRNSLQLGVALSLRIHRLLRLEVRGDYLFKNVLLEGVSQDYGLYLRSFPVLGGLAVEVLRRPRARISLAGLGGVGVGSIFSATALGESAPNITSFSALPIAFQGTVEFDFTLWKKLHLVLEGGYRYLRAPTMSPRTTGAGSDVFTRSFDFDLSGPYVLGGVSIAI